MHSNVSRLAYRELVNVQQGFEIRQYIQVYPIKTISVVLEPNASNLFRLHRTGVYISRRDVEQVIKTASHSKLDAQELVRFRAELIDVGQKLKQSLAAQAAHVPRTFFLGTDEYAGEPEQKKRKRVIMADLKVSCLILSTRIEGQAYKLTLALDSNTIQHSSDLVTPISVRPP